VHRRAGRLLLGARPPAHPCGWPAASCSQSGLRVHAGRHAGLCKLSMAAQACSAEFHSLAQVRAARARCAGGMSGGQVCWTTHPGGHECERPGGARRRARCCRRAGRTCCRPWRTAAPRAGRWRRATAQRRATPGTSATRRSAARGAAAPTAPGPWRAPCSLSTLGHSTRTRAVALRGDLCSCSAGRWPWQRLSSLHQAVRNVAALTL